MTLACAHRPSVDSRDDDPLIRSALRLGRFVARYYHRLRIRSPYPLAVDTPAILVANHINYLDPLLLQAGCPRLITWMMAREYYESAGLHWFCARLRAIPVNRDGHDLGATRAALRALDSGQVLGVFPEGRMETDGQMLPFRVGVGLLAIKSGAPVVPAYIAGTHRGKGLAQAHLTMNVTEIRYGPAMAFGQGASSRDAIAEAAARIQAGVEALGRKEGNWVPSVPSP